MDCGSRVTGYGVIEAAGRRIEAVAHGAIRLPHGRPLADRLVLVGEGLEGVLREFEPSEAAFEDVFTYKNARSALVLAQVRGAAMLSVARTGVEVASYSPAEVKGCVTGHGAAGKRQVRRMVKRLLGIGGDIRPLDASDALAVAYCHATRRAAAFHGVPDDAG